MLTLDVDPRILKLPPARFAGADPWKLQTQIAKFGSSVKGMPKLNVVRTRDGELMIYDGVTRATRVAKLLPGQTITIEITQNVMDLAANYPSVEDRL